MRTIHKVALKDLCTIDFIDKLIEAGVSVFKIEGRARPGEYVKRVTECYGEAIAAYAEGRYTPEYAAELKRETQYGIAH